LINDIIGTSEVMVYFRLLFLQVMIGYQATYHVLVPGHILKAFSYVVSPEDFTIHLFLVYITTLGYVLRSWNIDYYAVYVMS
jgi:hypothetical protein